ncbi:hypothetical protein ACLB2K_023759 [Fragaria x ananassa]
MSIMALQFPLAAVLLLLSAASTVKTAAAAHALPGCSDKCGDLTVPYPFGMKEGCYLRKEFFIKCSHTTQSAYLMGSSIIVSNISLEDGELQMLYYVTTDCYDAQGNSTFYFGTWLNLPRQLPYTVSHSKNKFYAVGCDTSAIMRGFRGDLEVTTGCMSICNSLDSVDNFCSGIGCCQINIPSGLNNVSLELTSFNNHAQVWSFNPCSYAFIEEQGLFNFSSSSLEQLNYSVQLPMVLNWAIGNEADTCDQAQNRKDFACKANSKCVNRAFNGSAGYLCQCSPGYEGNPYHPDGCKDIDDCKAPNLCPNGDCVNQLFPQNYTCSCHKGYKHDGTNDRSCIKNDPERRSKIVLLLIVSLGVSMGLLVFFLGISWICWGMKKREFIKLKEKYFKENGGLLLLQQLASDNGSSMKTTKIFTADELEKATNNYHESRILGEGGNGTVYKGILPDDTVVAIKKSKGTSDMTQSDQFVNEVIILSQINHRNVVKLLGCCLETEVPLLVYEFITHGTLYEHIHKRRSPLPFELRMKIATQSAEALSHLHSSISTPIIHRDVKTANILLGDDYTAKVSDFGASRLVPSGTDMQTLVLGTLGYLDPEYLQSNQLTEKSDVYSFGVVLVELITSKVPLSKDRCLASIFVVSMEEDWLDQILDDDIVNEGNIETVKKVANLAKRCLRVKGEERPTMKEVAKALEEMSVTAKHPWGFNASFCGEESEYLLGSLNSDSYVVGVGGDCSSSGLTSDTTNAYDSMQKQLQLMPYGGGR